MLVVYGVLSASCVLCTINPCTHALPAPLILNGCAIPFFGKFEGQFYQ
jgi:hypothetical protein